MAPYRWDLIIRGNPVKCKKSFKNGTVEDGRGLFSEVKLRLGTPERFSNRRELGQIVMPERVVSIKATNKHLKWNGIGNTA